MTFKAGESGNPSGRPKDKTPATAIRKAISDNSTRIVQVLIDLALQGDVSAARALLDRVCPVLKAVTPHVELVDANGKGLAEQGAAVISAAMTGQVSPDVASQLLSALASQAKLIETTVIAERLTNLEKILETRQ